MTFSEPGTLSASIRESIRLVDAGAALPNRLAIKINVIVNYGDSVLVIGDTSGQLVRMRLFGAQPDAVRESATVTVA